MNIGCALSDHLGRKPVVMFFIFPNITMDIMLLCADIQPATVFTVGALWGLTAITIPTLRAWVCDICVQDPVEMVKAQGAFRGYTIGPATFIGIPLGTAMALWANPKYAFIFSLVANIIALVVVLQTPLDDTIGIMREIQKREASRASASSAAEGLQLTASSTLPSTYNTLHALSQPTDKNADNKGVSHTDASIASSEVCKPERAWPSEGLWVFAVEHAPWSGFGVIFELQATCPSVTYLWLAYFLTFCANEVNLIFSSPAWWYF
jgi:hypothetical protein